MNAVVVWMSTRKTVVGCRLLSQPEGDRREIDPCLCNDDQWASESLTTGSRRDRWKQVASRKARAIYLASRFSNLLEGRYEILLVNAPAYARHFLDTKQILRIASGLLISCAHGLLKASFIPPQAYSGTCVTLVRTHTQLMQERNRHIKPHPQDPGKRPIIKFEFGSSTDIVGKSARQMLEALIAGESEPR